MQDRNSGVPTLAQSPPAEPMCQLVPSHAPSPKRRRPAAGRLRPQPALLMRRLARARKSTMEFRCVSFQVIRENKMSVGHEKRCVGANYFCKAPPRGGHLDLGDQNPTSRFVDWFFFLKLSSLSWKRYRGAWGAWLR